MSTQVNARIVIKQAEAAEWETENPVLLSGEFGYDTTNKIIKIGDGVTTWNDLTSIGGGGVVWGGITGVLSAQNDLIIWVNNQINTAIGLWLLGGS